MSKARVSARLYVLLTLTGLYMIAEIVVGYLVNSLALISDSFHMLSDFLALLVALWARRYSKKDKTETMTYGWRRAEIVGALGNGIFLMALCLNIIIEAIQRFFTIEEVQQPKWVLVVGAGGLAVNIIGMILFASGGMSHGHSHGGHGHGEHGHSHDHGKTETKATDQKEDIVITEGSHKQGTEEAISKAIDKREMKKRRAATQDMNLRGVFLHVLGDALGSVAVMISSLVIWLTSFPQRYYIDPIISLLITALILKSTIPLVRNSAKVLLQAVPDFVDVKEIRKDLEQLDDVRDIHEIHIWQLTNDLLVASLHITVPRSCNFMEVATTLKAVLHRHGIHAATIQPEFIEDQDMSPDSEDKCLLRCKTKCKEQGCCTKKEKSPAKIIP